MIKLFFREERGATMVEMSIIMSLLVATTFAVTDIGFALYQYNSIEKSMQMAVRTAIVTDPVATELGTWDCTNANVPPGTLCTNAAASTFGTVTCTGATTSCDGGFSFSTDAANVILTKINTINNSITMDKLVFTYKDLRLGYAGRRSPVATVSISLTDMSFEFLILDAFIGSAGPILMPEFRSTLSTEDLSSAG